MMSVVFPMLNLVYSVYQCRCSVPCTYTCTLYFNLNNYNIPLMHNELSSLNKHLCCFHMHAFSTVTYTVHEYYQEKIKHDHHIMSYASNKILVKINKTFNSHLGLDISMTTIKSLTFYSTSFL